MTINTHKRSQSGFTIIELVIATSIFSVILLIASSGIVHIGRLYYRSITQSRTQETARAISEELSRSVQFANGIKRTGGPMGQFCIGDTRYTPSLNQQVTGATGGLTAERIAIDGSCVSAPAIDTKQMLAKEMRLLKFSVEPADGSNKTWRVNLRIAYGDNDLLSHYDDNGSPNPGNVITNAETASCKSGKTGNSFCAVAQLDTLVKKRLN